MRNRLSKSRIGRVWILFVGLPALCGADASRTARPLDFAGNRGLGPASLVYSGYVGGADGDYGSGVAVDASGNAYLTGTTESDQATFPVTVGPDLTSGGAADAFVAKVRADGSGLVYAGYIGGAGSDAGSAIAVDAAGNAYITGSSDSDEATFPVVIGPDLSYNQGTLGDAFVARVRADGTDLGYAGYIGGAGNDWSGGIAVDAAGNAYVAGASGSSEATFPAIVGPDPTYNGGNEDAFVAKVRANGTALAYAGYIGGAAVDQCLGITVDATESAYLIGQTGSDPTTFPVAVGPVLTYSGGVDGFVAKVRPDGSGLAYAGYLGGTNSDLARGIAVDGAGSAYVTGSTFVDQGTFPVVVGPDLTTNGLSDAFVVKLRTDGAGLVYAGYIGGASYDHGYSVALDAATDAFVTGYTNSDQATFPVRGGPDLTHNGNEDAFVAKVRNDGTDLVYAGYVGGTFNDEGFGIAVDAAGSAYVTGYTVSDQTTFPVVVGPALILNRAEEAFVTKISGDACPVLAAPIGRLVAARPGASPGDIELSWQVDPAANGYNVWYVGAKEDIVLANQRNVPPAAPVGNCAVPSPATSNACSDIGGVGRGSPTTFFYQVRAYCDPSAEGP